MYTAYCIFKVSIVDTRHATKSLITSFALYIDEFMSMTLAVFHINWKILASVLASYCKSK